MDLFKSLKKHFIDEHGGDARAAVIDLLGADPIEVLNKQSEAINDLMCGNLLHIAATAFCMKKSLEAFEKSAPEEAKVMLGIFEKDIQTVALRGTMDKDGDIDFDVVK